MATSDSSFDVLLLTLALLIVAGVIWRGVQMMIWPQELWDRFSRPFFGSMMSPQDKSMRLLWRISGAVMTLVGAAFLVVLAVTVVAAVPAPQGDGFQQETSPAALPIVGVCLLLIGLSSALWPRDTLALFSMGFFIYDRRDSVKGVWIVRFIGVGFFLLAARTLYLWMSGR